MTSYFLLLNLAAVLCISFAHPAANDLKTKFAEDNEISGHKFASKAVSAEFGGYKVGAGLGGGDAGGGLFAKAEAPGASAGAGLYGGDGAGVSTAFGGIDGNKHPNQNGGGFFDRIFNIPISVLHSVNSYVKTKGDKGPHGSGIAASAGAGPGSTHHTETRFAVSDDDKSIEGASASASANGGASAAAGGSAGVAKVRGKPDYDKIFNIPISALQSVNDFLNG